MGRTRAGLLAATAAVAMATAAVTAPAAASSTPPAGWSASAPIPGTEGMTNPTAATAPNGTSVILSIGSDADSTSEIDARVQRAGSSTWAVVPPRIKDQPGAMSLSLAAAPDSTFWLAYSDGSVTAPETFATNLNPVTRKWTKPVQVFHDAGFGHSAPQVVVAGDGTVGIVASAQSANLSVYRVEVAMRRPGKGWTTHFLTPANGIASQQSIAASSTGYFAVSWIQGEDTAVVKAATHRPGGSWHVASLSVANDSQKAHLAIGPDGTVAVAWSAPEFSQSAERLSTTRIGRGKPVWTRRDLVTSLAPAALDAYPVVYKNGDVTAVWGEGATNAQSLWTSTLAGGVLSTPVQLSPAGVTSYVADLSLRPDGRVGLLYQRFGSTADDSGMSYLSFAHGAMSPQLTLTAATDDTSATDSLGIDAASENTVFLAVGTYPQIDLEWMSSRLARPSLMTSPYSGKAVSRARITGHPRVGRTLHCATGLWVGASKVGYSWLRNGKKIAHHSAAKYRVTHSDLHKHLFCTATGANRAGGHRTVKSKKRTIR